jgi:hypothetical protein
MHDIALTFLKILKEDPKQFDLVRVNEYEEEVGFDWDSMDRIKMGRMVFVSCWPDYIIVSVQRPPYDVHVEADYDVKDMEKEKLVALFKDILSKFVLY